LMGHILPYVLVLACPLSMGAMMWLMMRDKHRPDDDIGELKRRVQELERDRVTAEDAPASTEPVAIHGSPRADSP
jgi:hypothetical protein